jgi:translocation and assembly module TamB
MRWARIIGMVFVMAGSVGHAQSGDEKGYLTTLLEQTLSDAGRVVTVTGFTGALSSVASLDALTIADDQGVWLTLKDVTIDWSRADLLRGKVEVKTLTAKEIVLDRLPQSKAATLPNAEAQAFSLPELPVSINIERVAADRIVIGPTVLGQTVEAQINASLILNSGDGEIILSLLRRDAGPQGAVQLTARYSNTTQMLKIDLTATEGANGIAASLLKIPGAPSVDLVVKGNGPLRDFRADLTLATDDQPRLSGALSLKTDQEGRSGFSAQLGGNIAPLFVPQYADFFGEKIDLSVTGSRVGDGGLEIDQLDLSARSITLTGDLSLAPDGLAQAFHLLGRIRSQDGTAVLVPVVSGAQVRVSSVDLNVMFDSAKSSAWTGQFSIQNLDHEALKSKSLALTATGQIGRVSGAKSVAARVSFVAEGLAATDPDLARALGTALQGDVALNWREGDDKVVVSDLAVSGAGMRLLANGAVSGTRNAVVVAGEMQARLSDFSRLSGLAQRPLSGAVTGEAQGTVDVLSGAFDVTAKVFGEGLGVGVPAVDGVLAGASQLDLSISRTATGTVIRELLVQTPELKARAKGTWATAKSNLTAQVDVTDLRVLGDGYRGALNGTVTAMGTLANATLGLNAVGQGLGIGQPEIDKLLKGQSAVTLELALNDGVTQIKQAQIANPQVQINATGALSGDQQTVTATAKLGNLGLLLPEFSGPLTLSGRAIQNDFGTTIDFSGTGPGQISASVKGKITKGFTRADLVLRGRGQAALANVFLGERSIAGSVGFDLKLNGPWTVQSLTGNLDLSGGRIADPKLNFALTDIAATANLVANQMRIQGSSIVSSGGRIDISGTIATSVPFQGNLGVGIKDVTLRDPQLYTATLNGGLTVVGPLAGGAKIAGNLAMTQTELRVPSTGLGPGAALPALIHRNEPGPVLLTRGYAGQLAVAKTTSAPIDVSYGLDVLVSAPKRIFIRGRGLDAELGGELRLLGTTTNVLPSGSFSLSRGRLEILGKRLNLSEAVLQLQGALIPFIRIKADTQTKSASVGVLIEGAATNPLVSFTSVPQLPEEEVLAQLLFGQNLQNLSPLQALQLANAVATLAGRGGEGVISRLRRGVGLDNLDVRLDANGVASITAGKYLTEKVYSEFTVDQLGKSQINLNLDLSKSIILRGRLESDGASGLGVFLEKDF